MFSQLFIFFHTEKDRRGLNRFVPCCFLFRSFNGFHFPSNSLDVIGSRNLKSAGLIRDFDSERTFQNLIDKIDYFKNLNINAIELMPVMEFEGNESWGYNTAFHMAVDKFYGPENKLKEFIDLCHQNEIAVILDLVMNHVMGRSPMNRMWMQDPNNDGWGPASTENPYFNLEATHSYSLGNDFNHQSTYTQYYTHRVIKRWIEDFKIDGIRWDSSPSCGLPAHPRIPSTSRDSSPS